MDSKKGGGGGGGLEEGVLQVDLVDANCKSKVIASS